MAVVALKIKILPETPETNLEELKGKLQVALEKAGAVRVQSIETEPIAFGLNALIITLAWPEQMETDTAENACKIEGVGNTEIIDYRRAFG